MKLPSFKQCLLTLVACFGHQSPPVPYNNNPKKPTVNPFRFIKASRPTPAQARISKRFYSNQRQLRKDRRRRFAAGDRHAFN